MLRTGAAPATSAGAAAGLTCARQGRSADRCRLRAVVGAACKNVYLTGITMSGTRTPAQDPDPSSPAGQPGPRVSEEHARSIERTGADIAVNNAKAASSRGGSLLLCSASAGR